MKFMLAMLPAVSALVLRKDDWATEYGATEPARPTVYRHAGDDCSGGTGDNQGFRDVIADVKAFAPSVPLEKSAANMVPGGGNTMQNFPGVINGIDAYVFADSAIAKADEYLKAYGSAK